MKIDKYVLYICIHTLYTHTHPRNTFTHAKKPGILFGLNENISLQSVSQHSHTNREILHFIDKITDCREARDSERAGGRQRENVKLA